MPDLITTGRLRLRPWRAADAAGLLPLLEANQAHIAPWIPRHVSEIVPLQELATRLEERAAAFVAGTAWRYASFLAADGRLLGEVSLFPRDATGRVPLADADRVEIGYWLRRDMTGLGLATEAARAMLDVATALPQGRLVEIRCDPRNAASGAVAQRLGFVLAAPETGAGPTQVWRLDRAAMR
ncbi:N-acetyltransferase [Luteitalea sp. TBR-22]|nr:N-acetyltransferase [Luteitalea sp. TBR-22]